ncbi:unnamed protein product, partial [Trichogramma brassicae]
QMQELDVDCLQTWIPPPPWQRSNKSMGVKGSTIPLDRRKIRGELCSLQRSNKDSPRSTLSHVSNFYSPSSATRACDDLRSEFVNMSPGRAARAVTWYGTRERPDSVHRL